MMQESAKMNIINRYNAGESPREISNDYQVHSITIWRWLSNWGVKKRCMAESVSLAKTKNIKLDEKSKKIIEGELLGDGYLGKYARRSYSDYYFVLNNMSKGHCLLVKHNLPNNLFSSRCPWQLNSGAWALKSRSTPSLTKLREKWYPNGIKEVPPDFKFTLTSAYFWYLGDGGLTSGNRPHIQFATDGFSRSSVEHLVAEFVKMGYAAYSMKRSKPIHQGDGIRVLLRVKSSKQFLQKTKALPEYCYLPEYAHKWNIVEEMTEKELKKTPEKKVELRQKIQEFADKHNLIINPYAKVRIGWMEKHGRRCYCEPNGSRICPCNFCLKDIKEFNGCCLCRVFVTEDKMKRIEKYQNQKS